jgi:uncharacterized membrane protein
MRSWLLHARESFWFVPALFGLAAVLLALGLVEVDRLLLDAGITGIPLVADLSASGGRGILSAIGGTMLGVAATSFSITISVLATTSSAYGPRLVRNFMADRGNQVVLAVLTSTFLYALVVLRSIRTEDDSSSAFVPVVAVSTAVLLAVGDVAVLVYFIHHIATSVQVTTLQERVLTELESVIDRLYPSDADPDPDRGAGEETAWEAADDVTTLCTATRSGYVEQVALAQLVAAAREEGAVYRLRAHPGDHVLAGDPVLAVRGGSMSSSARDDAVRSAIVIAAARTPHQDARFAVQQVVEIGVRGLASGTNDPYTAVGAIDALTGALVTLCSRPGSSSAVRDADGAVRVVVAWPRPEQLLAEACGALRDYGMQHTIVVRALIRFLQRLEAVATGTTREALAQEVDAFTEAYRRNPAVSHDDRRIQADLTALRALLP